MKDNSTRQLEIWAGVECTYNRVKNHYHDQLEQSGFYHRADDIDRVAALGVTMFRMPAIWEKHQPAADTVIDWTFTRQCIHKLQQHHIEPIAGLVHHGSGPKWVSFLDGSFEEGLAKYAAAFAKQFPHVKYYTPVNEPLTTARFCGLYGLWFPHKTNDETFLQILISECKATVLAMQAIRKINPAAQLVQTDDLGKTHSTKKLHRQAGFENHRRWLSFDLLCGKVDKTHALYGYLRANGVSKKQLDFFRQNICAPDIIGINHYLTSERFLDQNLSRYPKYAWGGNGEEQYADVEAVRVSKNVIAGPYKLLRECWKRYRLPLAVTEVHLHCTREEQLRWVKQVYDDALQLKKEGGDVRAITAWAVYGAYDWCSLLTQCNGVYEPGLFDVRSETPRATAITKLVQALATGNAFHHPLLQEEGWWKRDCRIEYQLSRKNNMMSCKKSTQGAPVIITGKTGTLGNAFARICALRGIHYVLVGRDDVNITDEDSIQQLVDCYKPWAFINTAGFVRVDDAEKDAQNCFLANTIAPQKISSVCRRMGIKFTSFSSDLVFNGQKKIPYLESDMVSPLNIYGQSKAKAEELVLQNDTQSLIVRTSAFFGPWDQYNFVHHALQSFKQQRPFEVASDVTISPTYVPDLVNTTLDLMIDDENGIWNLSNKGEVTWAMLAEEIADRTGYSHSMFTPVSIHDMGLAAARPQYSVLTTEKGLELPSLSDAMERFFRQQERLVL